MLAWGEKTLFTPSNGKASISPFQPIEFSHVFSPLTNQTIPSVQVIFCPLTTTCLFLHVFMTHHPTIPMLSLPPLLLTPSSLGCCTLSLPAGQSMLFAIPPLKFIVCHLPHMLLPMLKSRVPFCLSIFSQYWFAILVLSLQPLIFTPSSLARCTLLLLAG